MLAFDMSSKYIHIVECSELLGKIKVNRAFSVPMPPQSMRNGFVTNSVALAREIRDEFIRRNIKTRSASVVLNSSTIKVKDIEVMADSEEHIIELMQKDISEIIVDEEHLIDYMVQRSYKKNKVPFLYCTLVAIPYSLVSSMGMVFREARLNLKKMDTHDNIVSKLWEIENPGVKTIGAKEIPAAPPKAKKPKKKKGEADIFGEDDAADEIVSSGSDGASKPISEPVKLKVGLYRDEIKLTTNGVSGSLFSKNVVIGGDDENPYSDVDLALDEELSDQERMQKEEENNKYRLMQYMQNISSFVGFQRGLNNGHTISEIQIYGDESNIPNVCDLIQQVVEIPTVLVKPPSKISVPAGFDFARYSCALGALLRR